MRRRRLLIACFLLALMAFSLSVLLPTGRFRGFTTSDSWWFYRLADDIARTDGMVENDNLSHPPTGLGVSIGDQLQPLIGAMVYEGLHSADNRVTIEEVTRYLPPIFFISMLIPVFLIGREFAGDLGGCAAAFFLAMMMSGVGTTSPLYWSKVGGFDREVLQQVMGAWIAYFMIRVLKNPSPQPAIVGGLVYGLFAVLWVGGAIYFIPIALLAVVLIVLNESLPRVKPKWNLRTISSAIWEGLRATIEPIRALAIMLAVGGLLSWFLAGFSVGLPVALLSIALLVSIPLYRRYRRKALLVIGVGVVIGAILTLPYWLGLVMRVLEVARLKAPAFEPVRYAGEAQPTEWGQQLPLFYGGYEHLSLGFFITFFAFALFFLTLAAMLLTRKRHELFLYSWLIGLVVLASDQVRFLRQWWPLLAVLVGIGFAMVLKWGWKAMGEPTISTSSLADVLRKPLAITLCVFFLSVAFVQHARTESERTGPPGGVYIHEALVDVSEWMKANTPENSVVAVQWSYGHQVAAWARRPVVVDGRETSDEEGEWKKKLEKGENVVPDYIYRVVGGRQVFLGSLEHSIFYKNTPPHPWGRRLDVDRLFVADENEFRDIIRLYRENYGVNIKYIIFTRWDYIRALEGVDYALKRPGEIAKSSRGTFPSITYEFENENVTLDTNNWIATRGGVRLAGVIPVGVWPDNTREYLRVLVRERFMPVLPNYRPDGLPEVLWVEIRQEFDPARREMRYTPGDAGLVRSVPMAIRVFLRRNEVPGYLRERHRAANGGAVVYEILL